MKILLIDDDAVIRGLVPALLATCGCEVATASDADEGVRLLASVEPDLVLLDWSLGDRSGLEVFETLQSAGATNLRIAFLTASQDAELHQKLSEKGAVGILAKPIDVACFAEQVITLLSAA